jgi:hypothetical protein
MMPGRSPAAAHELRLAVEDRASDSEVRAAFDRVRRSCHAVRDEVAHSDSRVARSDFGPVTDSYRAVESFAQWPQSSPQWRTRCGLFFARGLRPPRARSAAGMPI